MTATPAPDLWRDPDFRKLWTGQTASQFGGQMSQLTLTLIAVVTIGAGAGEVGLLRALQQAPVFFLALFVGAWVDRIRGRAAMVAADLARAVVLAGLPLLYALHMLGITVLYTAAVLIGVCSVFFDVAYQAYLLRLVRRDQLPQGNSLLESSRSAAQIGGPALSGVLLLLSGPVAAAISAVCFAASGLCIGRIRRTESVPSATGRTAGVLGQIRAGLNLVGRDAALRAIVLTGCTFNLSYAAFMTAYLLFLPRELGLSTGVVGVCLAALGPGSLIGSLLSSRLPRRLGYGVVLIGASLVSDAAMLAVSGLHGSGTVTVVLLLALNFLFGLFAQTVNVAVTAVRQAITADAFQGRVAATVRFGALGLTPLGSLLGGYLATQAGLRFTVLVTAVGLFASPLVMAFSPLVRLGRRLPAQAPAEARRTALRADETN